MREGVSNQAWATFLRHIADACTELADELTEPVKTPAVTKPAGTPRGFSYDRLGDLLEVIASKCVPDSRLREAAKLIGYRRLPGELFRQGWVVTETNDDDMTYVRLTEDGEHRLARLRKAGFGDQDKVAEVIGYYRAMVEAMYRAETEG